MGSREIESIMLINWYYVGCKLDKPKSVNTELVFTGGFAVAVKATINWSVAKLKTPFANDATKG